MSKQQPTQVECGAGWAALYQPLIDRCKAEGAEISQVKEKFGAMRFYAAGCSAGLRAAIVEAEQASLTVCEVCGAPGVRLSIRGWLKTLCDAHHAERSKAVK